MALPMNKRAKIRQLLADIKKLVSEYSDEQILEHKEIFTGILELVEKLQHIKRYEDVWSGDYSIPRTIYMSQKSNQEVI